MKQKFPRNLAWIVAKQIREQLAPSCERIEIAGSLRRRKPEVGDIEILYVPKTTEDRDLYGAVIGHRSMTDAAIWVLENSGTLARRKNIKGAEAFGAHIKLMVHIASGIPVDLFCTTLASWWNYLVCRTGGAVSNTRIAALARSRGYKWEPYSSGFVDLHDGARFPVASEEEVFRFVRLPFEQPWQRP